MQCLLSTRPLLAVITEHLLDHRFSFITDAAPLGPRYDEGALLDFLENFLVVFASEGWVAAEQNIHDDATAPDVTFLVVSFHYNFGRNIIRRTKLMVHLSIGVKNPARAKVNDLNDQVIILITF